MLDPLCQVQECGRGRNPFAVKKYCLRETARSGRAAPKGFVSPDIVVAGGSHFNIFTPWCCMTNAESTKSVEL
jgi:hypothetical protein